MPTTTFNIPSPLRVSITKEDLATLITNNLVAPVGYFITNSSHGNIYVIGDLPNTIRKTAVRENSVTGKYEYGTYDLGTDTFTVQGGGIAGITPSSGVNIDNTDPANPQPWINDFNLFLNPSGENNTVEWSLSGAGNISFESAELDSPNNKRMIKFDLAASNSALAEYTVSTDYIGQKMVFKAMIKTNENLDIRIELDDVEVATAEVESSSEWQLVSVPFTPETGFAGNVKIFIENANAAVYFLDMMYVGVDVFQKLPYIPLAGTEAGNPVTGPIELDLASKIFNTNGIEEAGLGGDIIDGLPALFLYFVNLISENKRGIGVNNTGVYVADEQGYGLIGTSYFSHGIPESFVQRKFVTGETQILEDSSGDILAPYSKNPIIYKGTSNGVYNLPDPTDPDMVGRELFITNRSPNGSDLQLDGDIWESGAVSTKTLLADTSIYMISDGEYWTMY